MRTRRLSLAKLEGVLHLQLNSPPANRTDEQFFSEFSMLLGNVEDSEDIRGMIISSQGRHFSSGANIEELLERQEREGTNHDSTVNSQSLNLFKCLHQKPYPVVCAIQGCCLGSGMELALACHYRIAVKTALLGLPETSYKLMPGCGGTVYLPQLIGKGPSIEIILGAHNLLAEDALKIGLIDMIVKKEDLLMTAQKLVSCCAPRESV